MRDVGSTRISASCRSGRKQQSSKKVSRLLEMQILPEGSGAGRMRLLDQHQQLSQARLHRTRQNKRHQPPGRAERKRRGRRERGHPLTAGGGCTADVRQSWQPCLQLSCRNTSIRRFLSQMWTLASSGLLSADWTSASVHHRLKSDCPWKTGGCGGWAEP